MDFSGRGRAAAIEGLWAAERGRVILWTPVMIGLGIGIYFLLPYEPGWHLPTVVVGFALIAAIALPRGAVRLLAGAILLVALGFLAAVWRTLDIAAPVLERRMPPMALEGRIDQVEWRGPRDVRLEIRILSLSRLDAKETPARVRLTARTQVPADIRVGDRISTLALLWPPPQPTMPNDFDFGRDLFFDRIGALGVAVAAIERQEVARGDGVMERIEHLRQTVSRRIRDVLQGPSGALGDALVTGYRAAISKDLNEAMRDSGLSHLISISGLHMSMVVGIVFLFVRRGLTLWERVALGYPIKKWAAFLAGFVALGYLGLSGASVPAQRSFLMCVLVLMAVILDRQPLSLRFVAAVAAFLLLWRPESLLSVSFQMSFAAVFALIAVYGEIGQWRERRRALQGDVERKSGPLLSWIRRCLIGAGGIMLSSVIAEFAIAPIALYHFHQTALYGMVANLIAIPLTGIWIMPMLVLAVFMMPLGWEALPLKLAGYGLDLVIHVGETVASQPGSTVHAPAFPALAYVIFVVGGLWLLIWRTRWRFMGIIVMACGTLLAARPQPPDILIAGQDDLVALKGPDGHYWMSPGRKGSFIRARWAAYTASDIKRWQWGPMTESSGPASGNWLTCDSLGCLYYSPSGRTVAIVHEGFAFAEDCAVADLVISALRAPSGCKDQADVIDRGVQRRGGGHAVYFLTDGQGGVITKILAVGDRRNARPWGGHKMGQ